MTQDYKNTQENLKMELEAGMLSYAVAQSNVNSEGLLVRKEADRATKRAEIAEAKIADWMRKMHEMTSTDATMFKGPIRMHATSSHCSYFWKSKSMPCLLQRCRVRRTSAYM